MALTLVRVAQSLPSGDATPQSAEPLKLQANTSLRVLERSELQFCMWNTGWSHSRRQWQSLAHSAWQPLRACPRPSLHIKGSCKAAPARLTATWSPRLRQVWAQQWLAHQVGAPLHHLQQSFAADHSGALVNSFPDYLHFRLGSHFGELY